MYENLVVQETKQGLVCLRWHLGAVCCVRVVRRLAHCAARASSSLRFHWLLKLVGAFPSRMRENTGNLSVLAGRPPLLKPAWSRFVREICQSSPASPSVKCHRQNTWTVWGLHRCTFTVLFNPPPLHTLDLSGACDQTHWAGSLKRVPLFLFLFVVYISIAPCRLCQGRCRGWCARLPDRTIPARDSHWKVGFSGAAQPPARPLYTGGEELREESVFYLIQQKQQNSLGWAWKWSHPTSWGSLSLN